jgi:mRNA-degrading endonuclease RelE of RelBE toxin-antitoxin system
MENSIFEKNDSIFYVFNRLACAILYLLRKNRTGLFSCEILVDLNKSHIKIEKSQLYSHLNSMLNNDLIKRGQYYKHNKGGNSGGFKYKIAQFGIDILRLFENSPSRTQT